MQDSTTPPATGYPYPYPNPRQPPANGYPAAPPHTAYPYPNPNPYYHHHSQPSPRATLYRRLLIILLAVVLILGTIWLVLILVLRPRLPEFHLTRLAVSNFNITDSRVAGNWDFQFHVRNPNKKISLAYDDITCYVYYDDSKLGDTELPPFSQVTRDDRFIDASLSGGTYVPNAIGGIGKEKASGSVQFEVVMLGSIGYRYNWYHGRRRYLRVSCIDVVVKFSPKSASGKMDGTDKECRVR